MRFHPYRSPGTRSAATALCHGIRGAGMCRCSKHLLRISRTLRTTLPLRACFEESAPAAWISRSRWKYCRYDHAPSLRYWTKIVAKPCNAMFHPTANPFSCKSGGHEACRSDRPKGSSDSRPTEKCRVAIFSRTQYNLKHGRAASYVPRLHVRALSRWRWKMSARESGGPFAAVIVKEGRIIAEGTNRVNPYNDPTAQCGNLGHSRACRVSR